MLVLAQKRHKIMLSDITKWADRNWSEWTHLLGRHVSPLRIALHG